MALTTIVNIVLVAIIIICAWQGFKKGIIMGVLGILVFVLALFGGQLLSDTFSSEIIPVIKPFISGYLDTRIEDTAYEVLGFEADVNGNYDVTYSMTDMLDSQPETGGAIAREVYLELGIYEDIANELADKTVTYASENGVSISSAIITMLCQLITWYGGFLVGFIILFALMTVIINLPNLSFRIPYVGIINDIGGVGIGIFQGFLFCALIIWFLQFAGLLLPEATMRSSGIISFFLDRGMLGNYISF